MSSSIRNLSRLAILVIVSDAGRPCGCDFPTGRGTRDNPSEQGRAEARAQVQGKGEERPAQEEGTGLAAQAGPDDRVHDRRRDVGLARRLARRQDDRLRAAWATFTPCRSTAARPRRSRPGLAFDSQPSYSPDGKTIAFVSDRDGAENLWVAASGRLGAQAADQGQAEPVRLAVVDARRRLRARLATAAAPVGGLRALDVPPARRLGRAGHQGQAQARLQAAMITSTPSAPSPRGTASIFTTPSGTSSSTPITT